jgi:hypothetical protein
MADKNNLLYQAKEAKRMWLKTSYKHFKDEYEKLYAEYKKAGGKRKL